MESAIDTEFDVGVLDIVYHGLAGGSRRLGSLCPKCGRLYVEGLYTIESPTHILGRSTKAVCCETMHPTPAVFTKIELVRYLNLLAEETPKLRSLLIPKSEVRREYFNPERRKFFVLRTDVQRVRV